MKQIILVTSMLCAANAMAQANLESSQRALAVIADFAKTMCADPDYKGSTSSTNAGAKATAEVNRLLKNLADVNVQVGAEVKREAFQGLLQKDLLEATKTASSCRLSIYNDLKDRMLPKKDEVRKPADPISQDAPRQARFVKLAQLFGLPIDSKVGWGSPVEDFEKLIPANERAISRTDAISVKGKADINSIPATIKYIFENRKLVGVTMAVDTWYSNYEEGNVRDAKTTFTRTEGDERTGKKLCTAEFIREVERKMDNLFSKTKNLESERKIHRDFVPQSYGCSRYGCKSESKSDIWTIGYKDSESSDISVKHTVRQNHFSYEGTNFKVGEEKAFGCATEVSFSGQARGGI